MSSRSLPKAAWLPVWVQLGLGWQEQKGQQSRLKAICHAAHVLQPVCLTPGSMQMSSSALLQAAILSVSVQL